MSKNNACNFRINHYYKRYEQKESEMKINVDKI